MRFDLRLISERLLAARTQRKGIMGKQKTTAENLEARFGADEEVLDYFDAAKAAQINQEKARLNLDLPKWMILRIDRVAGRNGLARQSQIKAWLADQIKEAV